MHILEHVKAKIGTLPPFAARFAVSDLLFAADNSASIKLYFPNSMEKYVGVISWELFHLI